MALPALFLPLLFSGLSMGANMMGARKQDEALAAATTAETSRQKRFDEQAYALNDKATDRYDNVAEQQSDRTENLAQLYKDAASSEPVTQAVAAPQSSSNLVVASDARAKAKADARAENNAENLATLRSFGDLFGDLGRDQQRDASELNILGSFKRGSQSVLPMELQAAQSKGSGWRLAGDLFGAAGAIATPMALTAGGLPGWFGGGAPLAGTEFLAAGAPAKAGAAAGANGFNGPLLPALY